jgi:hypothetical protein
MDIVKPRSHRHISHFPKHVTETIARSDTPLYRIIGRPREALAVKRFACQMSNVIKLLVDSILLPTHKTTNFPVWASYPLRKNNELSGIDTQRNIIQPQRRMKSFYLQENR